MSAAIAALTPRQREVARLVAAGLQNKEIAGELCISNNTVRRHVQDVFGRVGCENRVQLAALVLRARQATM